VDLSSPAQHWRDPTLLATARHNFVFSDNVSGLQIKNVKSEDGGRYRCRVDFEHQQTVIWWILLVIIVPPEKPRILQTKNTKIRHGEIDIRHENATIYLKCKVSGGVPLPFVSWWKDEVLIDSTYERHGESVVNEAIIKQVTREDQHSVLTCKAANNNISAPAASSVRLNIRVLPSSVEIVEPDQDMVENKPVTFECLVKGANPRPKIVWLKDEEKFSQSLQYDSEGETLVSAIFLTPIREDNGKYITCRADVPGLPGYRQQSVKMEVKYAPTTSIKLGGPLELERIEEGHDVYFECNIDANPPANSIMWQHNGQTLFPTEDSHILDSDNILAIQSVRINHSGNYSCSAKNELGAAGSGFLAVNVKYPPKCLSGQRFEYEASIFQALSIYCSVQANPGKDLSFHWVFNSSVGKYEQKDLKSDGSTFISEIQFTPSTGENIGNISCYASNTIGQQAKPCVFTIIPLFPPPSPTNCLVRNITHSQFSVFCITTNSNSSMFSALVSVSSTGEETFFTKSFFPTFLVRELLPSTSYTVKVWASNANGNSEPNYITTTTLNVPDIAERKLKGSEEKPVVWLFVFIGLTLTVIVFVISVMTFKLCRHERLVTNDTESHNIFHEIDTNMVDEPRAVTSPGISGSNDQCRLMAGNHLYKCNKEDEEQANKQLEQGSPSKELQTFSPKLPPEKFQRHSVSNPTFYIAERSRQLSKNCSESLEVTEAQVMNKRYSDTRAYASVTDKRNKLIRESFI